MKLHSSTQLAAVIVMTVSCEIIACDESPHAVGRPDRNPRAENSDAGAAARASNGERCTAAPTTLLSMDLEAPDAGSGRPAGGYEVPRIAVVGSELYLVLNWYPDVSATSQAGNVPNSDGAVVAQFQCDLMRMPLPGGSAVRVATIPNRVTGLTAAGTSSIVFVQSSSTVGGNDVIMRFSRGDDGPKVLAETVGPRGALAVDGDVVYFTDADGPIKRVSLEGGTVATLGSTKAGSIQVRGQRLYFGSDVDQQNGWTIFSMAKDGTDLTVVARIAGYFGNLIECGPNTCWMDGSSTFEKLVQLGPDGVPIVLAENISEPLDAIFDGKNFFFAAGAAGLDLLRVPAQGGTPVLAEYNGAVSLALDDTCLYWSGLHGVFSVTRESADTSDL